MSPTDSAPPETAIHHVRNLLQAFAQPSTISPYSITFGAPEAAAIVARLHAIQRELEQPRGEDLVALRANCHATFNGGWHGSADGLRAFHHGMDTVINVLEAHQEGRAANGIPAGTLRVGESIHLRAVGDHVERVYPEAASAADEGLAALVRERDEIAAKLQVAELALGFPIIAPHAERCPTCGAPAEGTEIHHGTEFHQIVWVYVPPLSAPPEPTEAMRQLAEFVVLWDGAGEDGCGMCNGEYIGDSAHLMHEAWCPIPVVRLDMIARLSTLDPEADSVNGQRLTRLADAQQAYERAALRAASPEPKT